MFNTVQRKRARRRTLAGLTIAIAMAALAACGSGPASSSGNVTYKSDGQSVVPSGKSKKDLADIKLRVLNQLAGAPVYAPVEQGVKDAAEKWGIKDVEFTGPSAVNASQQVQILNTWITQKVDVIAVAATDGAALKPSIDRAVKQGILVLTWDSDAGQSDRALYINYWDPIAGPAAAWDELAKRLTADTGNVLISTPNLSSKTHQGWIKAIQDEAKKVSPGVKFLEPFVSGGDQPAAVASTKQAIQSNDDVIAVVSVDAAGTPAAAQATKELGLDKKIQVSGLSTPSQMKPFVDSGQVKDFVLFDPYPSGYFIVEAAANLLQGKTLETGKYETGPDKPFNVVFGKPTFGTGTMAIAAPPVIFTKENLSKYPF